MMINNESIYSINLAGISMPHYNMQLKCVMSLKVTLTLMSNTALVKFMNFTVLFY
uniref:Uncharacterized protein n=1 Tax=Anguilla anguilla TaxID=7936 RepID=A0A0E9V6J2_ANGAN